MRINQADLTKALKTISRQIHDNGGKKMNEEIPELNQSSQFVFSMLNNSRFVIK